MARPGESYWYPLSTPTIGDDEIDAAVAVLRSGRTTMGEKVEEFEEAFARRVGASHAIMVNSGSSADLLIAFAHAAGRHLTVAVPAVTWPTQAWAWQMAGADVRLVDVDGINTTAEILAAADDLRPIDTVSLVHLMGVPCDMDPIVTLAARRGWTIFEDCCEAFGATYGAVDGIVPRPVGTFGQAAAWSFFFSHHITTMEGGMVTTDNPDLAARIRTLRSHGWARHLPDPPAGVDPRYTFVDWGFNVRPTELAAAIGLVQLGRADTFAAGRAANLQAFTAALEGNTHVSLPGPPPAGQAAWFGLPLLVDHDRDGLAAHLEAEGVETRPILAGNLARQPAVRLHAMGHDRLVGADRVHDHGLYVGLHPTPCEGDVEYVANLINAHTRERVAV